MQVNPNISQANVAGQVGAAAVQHGVARKPSKKLPDAGLPKDSFQGSVGQATKKDEAAMAQQAAVKGGKLVDVNGEKRIQIGNDWYRPYVNRKGYEENFLGTNLEMPSLDPSIKDKAAPRLDSPGKNELEYTNFSIVMNKERRMPFFTAVNIDGGEVKEVARSGKWLFDPRIDREHQLGNAAYKRNDIDRGHMVRRRDATWGDKAEQGSTDTFVYTNAALQHKDLNQDEWLDLENRVLDKAMTEDKKMTVFTGPVYRDSDPSFDNGGKLKNPTKIPQDFWKVVAWNDPEKGLQSEAFVMSQKADLVGKGNPDEQLTKESEFNMYRVPIGKLEELTKLDFGSLGDSNTQKEVQQLDLKRSISEQLA